MNVNVIDKVRFKRNTQNKIIIVTQISIIYLTRSLVIIRSMIIILKNMRTLIL